MNVAAIIVIVVLVLVTLYGALFSDGDNYTP